MFESYVVYYLNQYLGKYVDGIDQKSLRISIYKGDVVLKNLQLRPDALAALDLPVTVRAGLLGSLTLKVPWSSLGTVPVEVKIDRLYLLASPKSEEERSRGVQCEEGIEPAYQLAKRQRVATQEEQWVQELQAAQEQQEAMKRAGGQGGPPAQEQGGGVGGMLKAVIDTVIGNLQLSISNVHIRYEDSLTNPGHPFACGITLDSITGYTVDELGREAFVTNNPLQMLRKALRLQRMAVYFDTDAEFWRTGGGVSWRQLAPHEWDEWFQPGISVERQERGGTARHRQYVLQPVDGRALYTRRGAGVSHKEDDPVVEMDFQLDVVAVRLSQPQYQSYHLLLAEVSSFSARMPYSAYRPRLRPAAGEQALIWWRYAVKAVQQQIMARKLSWGQAVKFARMREEYVPLYVEHLRNPIDPSRPNDRLPKGIVAMDRELPEQTIVMFRRLAHAKLQREKRQKAAQEAAAGGKAAGGGGWLDWLRGGAAETKPPPAAGMEGEAAPELSPEEYNRLVELVMEQEQGLRLGAETPYTLLTRINARVGSASALLVGSDGTRVLRGGLEGIQLSLSKYPETLRVELGVTAMGMESPEGTFIQTGAQLQRLRSATDLSEEMEGAEEQAGARALAVVFVQKPQDGSADGTLNVVLTPSYVYYSATAVDRVVNFFKTPEQLDLSNLSAQATTQLERARRLAAQYASAALQSRPKLKLHLVLDAPKVAIPAVDAAGRATLALDFGRFIIESDFDTAGKLPAEEAALYECVRLNVCDVAAYVADGEFNWQQRDKGGQLMPLLERTGMDIALQAARFLDPRYPVVRLQPTIPVLHFYLSPGRMGRMLRVIRAALPASEEEAAGTGAGAGQQAAAGGSAGQELWRQHAEYEGGLKVLTWTGLGRTNVTWCSRHGIIYQGKLYLYEGPQPGARLAATESLWTDRRVIRVPPDKIGGAEHVVALCPESLDLTRLAESTSSLVLRLESEEEADAWYRYLQQAQQSMQALAGEGAALLPPDWEEASSTVSGTEADEAAAASGLTAAQGPPPGTQAAEAGQVPSTVLQFDAQLGELAIFGSGREPSPWWPPEEADDREPARTASGTPTCASSVAGGLEGFVSVDGEVPLIVLRAAGGTCRFTYGAPGMTVHTALGSLEIQDLLVGQRCPRNRFLASSHAGVESVGEDVFFDADDELSSGLTPRSSQSPSSPMLRGLGSGAQHPAQDLAEFTFKLRPPGSPEYEGVDTSLDVSLSSLYFYCNRPTVAALITLGVDIGNAASAAFGAPEAPTPAASGLDGGGEEEAAACQTGGEEPEAAGEAAAVKGAVTKAAALGGSIEEALDQAQLLGSAGGADRSMFRFTASLGTLQVLLNYEGAGCHTLSQASVDRFSFELDIKPDTSMRIKSTLGNVRAVDCTLPEGHPYHQACGLREGSRSSLVSLEFCSFPPSYRHPSVPEGLQYYTLQAQLSELQLVFLYRFLQENLTYISTMLAMRLPPHEGLEAALSAPRPAEASGPLPAAEHAAVTQAEAGASMRGGAAAQQARQEEGQKQRQQEGRQEPPAQLQPFVLLMDVQASAPNISLPRSSGSLDSIELDLGSLSLKTRSIIAQQQPGGAPPLLVEAVDLCFSGVGCTVVQAAKRGSNVFQNAESGWQLHWRRPLLSELRREQPLFDLSLDLPFLKARLTDQEYQLMTSVAADNFAELPELPAGASWLNDHYQAILLEQQQALLEQQKQQAQQAQQQMEAEGGAAALARSTSQPAGSVGALPSVGGQAEGAVPARHDKSPTSVRVSVSIGEIELEALRHLEGLPQPLPLARFTIADLWVNFRNTNQGSMFVSLCLPRVEARDLRPEVPPEQSLVISSGHKASFLMLDWAASPAMVHQALAMTLQKPLLVAELSFLLAVTQFVVPTFAFVKSRPIPYVTHDLALTGKAHAAEEDLFLSPTVRLLADAPGACTYEYNGQGHRLVLPDKEHLDEPLPLILVGTGRTLRLRNLRLVNSASLAVCLQLAPGARLLASPEDGVELIETAEEDAELSVQLGTSPTSPTHSLLLRHAPPPARLGGDGQPGSPMPRQPMSPMRGLQPSASSGPALQLAQASPSKTLAAQQQAQQERPRTIDIMLSAVGVGLQFVHLDNGGQQQHQQGGSRPGSRPGSSAGSRHDSGADFTHIASQSPTSPAAAALAQQAPVPAKSVQMLAASLDLDAAYTIQDSEQSGRVEVQGLRVETRYISDMAARLAQRDQQEVHRKRKLRGQREGSVLDPCRLGLSFHLVTADEAEGARPALTDVRLEASDLRVTLSPDVLELGGLLAASALEPLMQPQPDQPLTSCNQFERVWSFDPAELFAGQPGGQLAVSLAVTGAEGGVTVWRAKTPTGYAVTGDVVTPGTSQPTFEVLAVAVNSGLAAYPSSYTRVWAGAGGAIWRPLPPPGYVAAGDVFTVDGREPELSDMVCLAEGTVVECAPGERLSLPPQLPHAPAVTAQAASGLPHVDLWCLDNSLGTFLATTGDLPIPECTYDLRTPLGVTPAALLAIGAAQEVTAWAAPPQRPRGGRAQDVQQPAAGSAGQQEQQQQQQPGMSKQKDPSEMFRSFQTSRRELRTDTVARLVTPTVVDFKRIWWSEGDPSSNGGSGEGVSIWRPMAPPGYVSLGDCLVRGQDPPLSACVVQDTGADEGFGHAQGMPLVKAPRGFEPVWEDSTNYADTRLVLWRPVPYPGYVAMGCVASRGTDTPPRSCVKCLRQDAATRASPGRSPTWAVQRENNARLPPLTAWAVDEKLHTFVAVAAPPDRAGEPQHAWKLRQPASEQAEVPPAQQAAGGVNVVIKAGQASVLLQDAFHVPLLEVSLGSMEAGVRGPSRAVVQAYLGFKLGVWSYNGAVKHWEPVVEPWDVIAQCAANYGPRMSSGIEPGVSVSIKSSNDCVYTTLAFSAVHSALMAYTDWEQLHGSRAGAGAASGSGRAMRALLAAGDAAAMHVLVDNRLGVESAMELDFGDRLELVKLPPGTSTPVVKPLPSFPLRFGDSVISAGALPHKLLLLDIQQATRTGAGSSSGGGVGSGKAGGSEQRCQLYCSVHLEAAPAGAKAPSPASSSGMSGRLSSALSLEGLGGGGALAALVRTRALPVSKDGVVTWKERLIVALPVRPGPAEQTLVFEVWDAAAAGGRGATLGTGRLTLPVSSLEHRQEHAAEISWQVPGGSSEEGGSKQQELRLQLSYMLQRQWSFGLGTRGLPGQDTWSAEASTAGQRALTLASQPGTWAVIPAFGHQKSSSAPSGGASAAAGITGSSASVVPLKVGKEGLVVESSVAQGTRRELLRALCQMVNSTELTLEACLVDVEDADWHVVAARAGSVSGTFSADSVEEEVFENERFARGAAGSQWAAANLRAGDDPRRFQYALQQADSFPKVDPPPEWEWESNWQVEHGPSTDADGWAYGPDFKSLHFPPPPGAQKPSINDYVRRRRWVRRRRRAGTAAATPASLVATALGKQQKGEDSLIVTNREVLGRAAPGEALPLPLGWSKPGRQLQLRPVLPVEGRGRGTPVGEQQGEQLPEGQDLQQPEQEKDGEGEEQQEEQELRALHDWSFGTADGRHTVKLDGLDDGITRLVCCPSLGNTALGSARSELEVGDLWFSLAVEGDILAASKQAKPMTDWRLVVSAPLRLTNQLPVAGSLLVWEQQAGGSKDLVGRQTVQVPSGGTVPIHTADMRRVVSFSFYPEGYEWVEPAPTVLSEGYSGRARGRQQLPDRFRLVRPGASVPLEVFIQRNITWGTWLLEAKEELDPGAVVAMGVPMSVVLLSPLWVVNATSLAIDAVIVPLEAPPPPPRPGHAPSMRGRRMATAAETFRSDAALRTINTDDADPAQRGEFRGRRFIAPSSMELLSYPLPSFLSQAASQLGVGGSSSGAAEQQQQAFQQQAQQRRRYGVRLRVAGSGWTPAMALDAAELAAGGGSAAGGSQSQQADSNNLQNARPVLIRALVREYGSMVHEVVARLEVTSFGTSQVLRLEPHVVISNRTSVPLQLLQSRLDLMGAAVGGGQPLQSPPSARQGRPAGAVVAEGGCSFTLASRGMNAALMAAGGPSLVRPSRSMLGGVSQLAGREESKASLASSAASFSTQSSCWDRAPSLLPCGTSPLVQLTASSFRESVQRNAVMDLPAGAASMPLPLAAGLPNHTLSFRCVPPPAYAAAVAADSLPLWSRPVTVRVGVEAQMHVVVPVIPAEEEGGEQQATKGSGAGAGAAHLTAGHSRSGSADAAHLTAVAAGRGGGHTLSAAGGSAGWPPAVAILRLSVHRRGQGAMHVVLESMHSDPPYVLENRTRFPLQYRQAHARGAFFHSLEPFSAVGYVWEYSMAGVPQELELQEGGTLGAAQLYALDASSEEQDSEAAPLARMQPLPLSAYPNVCSVRVAYFEQVMMGASGVVPIGGEGASGVLGRGGIDRVLQVAPGHEALLTAGAKALAPSRPDLGITFELPGLEVSIVDHTPRELLLLSATGLKAGVTLGSNPASAYKAVRLSVQRLQLDDMLTGTPFPVVLGPALQQSPGAGSQPLLAVTLVSVLGGARGRSYMPLMAVRWPLTLQLAISETLVWSAYDLLQRLQCDLTAASEAAAGGAAVAAADVPVRIRLLSVDSISTQISFQGDPFSRPRDLASGLVGSVIDLANFQAAPISLQGLRESNIIMLQSALNATIMHHIRSQVFSVGFSLARSFGVVGGASRALGALSAAVAKLATGSSSSARREQEEAKQKRSITDVGDGVLEGAGALGSSMLRGFRGLIEKPLQGAQQAGMQGAVKGVARGLLGVVANPVSGMLEAMSATAEGFDATFGRPKDHLLVMERRRPARVVSGEGKLMPLVRGGSTKQSRIEEIGQALLRNTLLAAPNGLRNKRQGAATEAYEEHFVLPDDRVVVLTSASILLIYAPGFAQLDGAAEIGAISVSDVSPGKTQWGVRWDDVLCFELRWSRQLQYPDRLIVHRKGTPGWQEEESLAHQIKCFESTPQASQIKLVAQKVLRKYYLDPLRRNQMWSRRHDAAGALPAGTPLDQLPPTMPCLDFALTWHTNPHKSPVVSFWRPLAPAGYRAVGDVLSLGLEPPTAPVPCFRDDVGLRISCAATAAPSCRSGDSHDEPPVAMCPREFSLIWRYNGKRPVTVWMPVAPPGYTAMGAVVRGEPEVPAAEEYLCIRSDLTSAARVFNSPIWTYDPAPALQAAAALTAGSSRGAQRQEPHQFLPHHPETWRVSIWQVDNRLGTFIAVRAFTAPPPDVPRTVTTIEERAAAKPAAAARQIPA